MEWEIIICAVGLIFFGFIIGYPLGHVFGRREAFRSMDCEAQHKTYEPCVVTDAKQRLEKKDILLAEFLEEK